MSHYSTMDNTIANRQYKDTVFRDLFGSDENRANALSLYNALTGSSYSDPSELEITTLDDVIYMNIKNDVSILVGEHMMLWEHQSTINLNMPLRGLVYFGRLYAAYVERNRLSKYSTAQLKLPTPYFYVFYNGVDEQPDKQVLCLSDAFEQQGKDRFPEPSVEVRATVLNINAGHNTQLMDACKTLADYAHFVQLTREYNGVMPITRAVDAAIARCIDEGVLAQYLASKRAEVYDMFMTEYNEADRVLAEQRELRHAREAAKAEGLAQGLAEGRAEGLAEGKAEGLAEGKAEGLAEGKTLANTEAARLFSLLKDAGRLDEYLPALEDPALMTALLAELTAEEPE